MLRNANGTRHVRHRFLHAVRACTERKQHLSEPQNNLGLMSKAVMRRHTLGEDLVATFVVMRPSRMCRRNHALSIPCHEGKCERRWSVGVLCLVV